MGWTARVRFPADTHSHIKWTDLPEVLLQSINGQNVKTAIHIQYESIKFQDIYLRHPYTPSGVVLGHCRNFP